jgi:hypothetical protein
LDGHWSVLSLQEDQDYDVASSEQVSHWQIRSEALASRS